MLGSTSRDVPGRTVVILGPTGSGQTRVAACLARASGGELVNLDSVFLYHGFPLTTGLSDTLVETAGVPRHLYEILAPDAPLPAPDDYACRVRDCCLEIAARGRLAIVEGCSTTYFPPLHTLDRREPFVDRFVVLDAGGDRAQAARRRVERALDQGLLAELRRGRDQHPDALVMRQAVLVAPLLAYLDDKLSREQAIERSVHAALAHASRQEEMLAGYRHLVRLPHDRAQPEETADRVADLLGLAPHAVALRPAIDQPLAS